MLVVTLFSFNNKCISFTQTYSFVQDIWHDELCPILGSQISFMIPELDYNFSLGEFLKCLYILSCMTMMTVSPSVRRSIFFGLWPYLSYSLFSYYQFYAFTTNLPF